MTEKVDIFSLGFVFFALVSGGLPFRDDIVGIPDLDPTWHSGYAEVTGERSVLSVLAASHDGAASILGVSTGHSALRVCLLHESLEFPRRLP